MLLNSDNLYELNLKDYTFAIQIFFEKGKRAIYSFQKSKNRVYWKS